MSSNAWTLRVLQISRSCFLHTQSLVAKITDRFDHSIVKHLIILLCSNRRIIDLKLLIKIIYSIYKHTGILTNFDMSLLNTHLSHTPDTFVDALSTPYLQKLPRNSRIYSSLPSNRPSHYYGRFTPTLLHWQCFNLSSTNNQPALRDIYSSTIISVNVRS